MSNVTPFQKTETGQVFGTGRSTTWTQVDAAADIAKERTFHFWRGASRKRYVHIVHDLFECPELTASNYILVRVEAGGQRIPLRIARTTSRHASENLAEIRMHAARLGATEVHLHVLADDRHAQAVTQWDLQASHFGTLICEGCVPAMRQTAGA